MQKYELISCVWELTRACNLRCIHCGSSAGTKRDDELSLDEALRLCDELKKTGCKSIALMGGEPLLSKNFRQVAERLKDLGIEISIITNGTIISYELIKFLKDLKPKAVATSIDGIKPQTHDYIRGVNGCFRKTMQFIEICLAENLPVSVITSVSKLNISELNGIAEMLKGRKIAWQIQIVGSEGGRFPKDYLLDEDEFYSVGIFLETLRRKYSVKELPFIGAHDMGYNSCFIRNIWLYDKWEGCQAGISVCGIRSNGDVLGCLSLNDDRFVEGNVKKRSFYDIWNDNELFKYTRRFSRYDAGPNCINCKYLERCKGGCNEMSLMKTNKLHNDPYCFYRYEKNNLNIFEKAYLFLGSYLWRLKKNDRFNLLNFFEGKRK